VKKIRDYTLGEAQDVCNGRKGVCKLSEDKCLFSNENSMCKLRSMVGPSKFDLADFISFTESQLLVMKELYKSGVRYIARNKRRSIRLFINKPGIDEEGDWVNHEDDFEVIFTIPSGTFPQIDIHCETPICIADYVNTEEIK